MAARIIWISLCFGTPLIILFLYNFLILHGGAGGFLSGFGMVPWKSPLVYGLLSLSGLTLVASAILPELLLKQFKFKEPSVFVRLRVRHLLTCLFLESIAVYGLVLGFTFGPGLASLSLGLILVPMVAGCVIFPTEHDWRYRFSLEHERS